MENDIDTTVVTAGDRAYAWGALMLVASMRRNGMPHPTVVWAMDWTEDQKRRICALGDVTVEEIAKTRQCLACQKPRIMSCDAVKTSWVCWVDADGLFVGDCSEWLSGDDADEVRIKRCDPPPPDFTPENLETWRRDVEKFLGQALPESRYATRVQSGVILMHRKWVPFLKRWDAQINDVLPSDVGILMKKGTAYFQTDESVLASLLCFWPDAPRVSEQYKFDGKIDSSRYYLHFGYNPKPWQMWNTWALRWREEAYATVEWLVAKGVVKAGEVPLPLRRGWLPLYRAAAPLAPWVWRAMKLKRRVFAALAGNSGKTGNPGDAASSGNPGSSGS
jgi:hypothetical protein